MFTFVEKEQGRELEVIKRPIGAQELIKSTQELAGITIAQKADLIAEEAALFAYRHGRAWANKALATKGAINPVTGLVKPFFLPTEQRAIEKIKQRNLMEIQGMSDELAKRMSRSMVEGFEKGETINLLKARVRDVTDFGKNRAEVIARTETMRAVNGAARDRYRQEGVEEVEFLAAWDPRTCPECEGLHGKIFPLDKAPDLPIHPQCRCTLAPVIRVPGEE
jgi:SPP1 gp7 family putative phage head morphogenesis protein